MEAFKLFVPKQAVGANLVYFDLFNASGSAVTLILESCLPIVSGAVAVVGTLGVDLFLTRTSAVGTGGTAADFNGTSLTAATISTIDPAGSALPNGVTARLTPTGGATAGAVLSWCSVFTEETNTATYFSVMNDLARRHRDSPFPRIPQGAGIRVVQGSVASVGNIGFELGFRLERK